MALLALLTAIWLIVDPRTPDMAAASYRVSLFASHGFSVLDANWYGGHDLPGYSLLFPPLGVLLGLKAVAALSVIASSMLFARLARSLYGSAAAWGTARVRARGASVTCGWGGSRSPSECLSRSRRRWR